MKIIGENNTQENTEGTNNTGENTVEGNNMQEGNAQENNTQENNTQENNSNENPGIGGGSDNVENIAENKSQMELDAEEVKKICEFQKAF